MRAILTKDFKKDSEIFEMECVRDSTGMLFQVHLMGHELLGKNYYLNRSNMDSFMITYMVRGHTNCLFENKLYKVTRGNFIFVDCIRPIISWVDEPDNGDDLSAEFYYIHLYPTDALRNLYSSIATKSCVFPLNDDCGFIDLVKELLSAKRNGEYDENKASVLIYQFLLSLKDRIKEKNDFNIDMPNEIRDVINYIITNYKNNITVSDCARIANMSPNYLETLFSKHLNMPILKYIKHYRFQKAADLLINTNKSIKEISNEVGLHDSQALIRLFKDKVNMTPLSYRKSNRNINIHV